MYITFYSVIHTKTKYTAIEKLCTKINKIVPNCNHLSSGRHHGFHICDFSTSISGDPGDVGGTANSSAVLSCSADTLTGPVLHTLDLLVMVMELFGLTIMFMNIIVAPTAMFLSFS